MVLDDNPSSLINLTLNGSIRSSPGALRRLPHAQFRQQLFDQDIAEAVTFSVMAGGNQAPAVIAAQVVKLRKTTDPTATKSSS